MATSFILSKSIGLCGFPDQYCIASWCGKSDSWKGGEEGWLKDAAEDAAEYAAKYPVNVLLGGHVNAGSCCLPKRADGCTARMSADYLQRSGSKTHNIRRLEANRDGWRTSLIIYPVNRDYRFANMLCQNAYCSSIVSETSWIRCQREELG